MYVNNMLAPYSLYNYRIGCLTPNDVGNSYGHTYSTLEGLSMAFWPSSVVPQPDLTPFCSLSRALCFRDHFAITENQMEKTMENEKDTENP